MLSAIVHILFSNSFSVQLMIRLSRLNTGQSSTSAATSSGSSGSSNPKSNTTFPTRSATKDDVFQFLEEQNVYADSAKFTYYKNTVKTPQHRAVAWLAREDHANFKSSRSKNG
jgi:hypothetical protein